MSYPGQMVHLQVVYNQVLLRHLDLEQLYVVEQLLPLDQLAGDLLRAVPLLVGGGDVLGGHRGLQADVLRLQVEGAGDVRQGLPLLFLGRHVGFLNGESGECENVGI